MPSPAPPESPPRGHHRDPPTVSRKNDNLQQNHNQIIEQMKQLKQANHQQVSLPVSSVYAPRQPAASSSSSALRTALQRRAAMQKDPSRKERLRGLLQ